MICLDTSIIIDLFRGDAEIEELLSEIDGNFAVSYPIVCELYKGAYLSSKPEKGVDEIEKFIENVRFLESGPEAAEEFGRLRERYPDKNDFDLMVASVCISEKAELLTRDDDFKGLEGLEKKIV